MYLRWVLPPSISRDPWATGPRLCGSIRTLRASAHAAAATSIAGKRSRRVTRHPGFQGPSSSGRPQSISCYIGFRSAAMSSSVKPGSFAAEAMSLGDALALYTSLVTLPAAPFARDWPVARSREPADRASGSSQRDEAQPGPELFRVATPWIRALRPNPGPPQNRGQHRRVIRRLGFNPLWLPVELAAGPHE